MENTQKALRDIKAHIDKHYAGDLALAAKKIGFTEAYIKNVLSGKYPISEKFAGCFGWEITKSIHKVKGGN